MLSGENVLAEGTAGSLDAVPGYPHRVPQIARQIPIKVLETAVACFKFYLSAMILAGCTSHPTY